MNTFIRFFHWIGIGINEILRVCRWMNPKLEKMLKNLRLNLSSIIILYAEKNASNSNRNQWNIFQKIEKIGLLHM